MTLKKMLLLASMALAAVAFSASTAQAAEWDTNGVSIGGEKEADEVTFTGELSTTAKGGALRNGPCPLDAVADLWNEPDAQGALANFIVVTPCWTFARVAPETYATLPCSFALGLAGVPWPVDVADTSAVAITGANFTYHYSGECAKFGIPSKITAGGTATGVIGGNCIEFANSGDLSAGPEIPVTIDGKLCASGLELTR